MAVHFVHIGKTGGTAIKQAVRAAGAHDTPRGPLLLHPHRITLRDLPADDVAVFCVRDPVDRFVSGFESRRRKGRPRYYIEWTPAEAHAFARFPTPQSLGRALSSGDPAERAAAEAAMRSLVQPARGLDHWLVGSSYLQHHRHQILYIARQETLSQDWGRLKEAVGLAPWLRLPAGTVAAHRRVGHPPALDGEARRNLQRWYWRDHAILRWCEKLRKERGWSSEPDTGP